MGQVAVFQVKFDHLRLLAVFAVCDSSTTPEHGGGVWWERWGAGREVLYVATSTEGTSSLD